MSNAESLQELESDLAALASEAVARGGDAPPARDEPVAISTDVRGRLHRRYWAWLFARLDAILAESPPDRLDFSFDDRARFDHGWISEELFPRAELPWVTPVPDADLDVVSLSEWIERMDQHFLKLDDSRRREEERHGLDDRIVSMTARWQNLREEREQLLAKHAGRRAADCSALFEENEQARLAIEAVRRLKRTRSISKRQLEMYEEGVRMLDRTQAAITAFVQPLPPEDRAAFQEIEEGCVGARTTLGELESAKRRIVLEAAADHREAGLLLDGRSAHVKEAFRQIKEDIDFCARWGRTEANSVLVQGRVLHGKAEVAEAIRRAEDFDPDLFRNRTVDRRGRPLILLAPGTGNGSYDFRTNLIVIPSSCSRSIEESVAFALALYRRDVDHATNGEALWKGFFADDVWRKIEERPRPTTVRDRLHEWASAYAKWTTREARGQPTLESALRRWFEEQIAPDRRSVIVPRDCRGLTAAPRAARIEEGGKGADAGTAAGIGTLHFLAEAYSEAFRFFERAVQLDDTCAVAHWGRGILFLFDEERLRVCNIPQVRDLRRAARLRNAEKSFQKYTRYAPPSWWTLKAQEYLREISSELASS